MNKNSNMPIFLLEFSGIGLKLIQLINNICLKFKSASIYI